jgi:hypothetical protein
MDGALEFEVYIRNNQEPIPNLGVVRWRRQLRHFIAPQQERNSAAPEHRQIWRGSCPR